MKLKTRVVGLGALAAIVTTYVLAFLLLGSPWTSSLTADLTGRSGPVGVRTDDLPEQHGHPGPEHPNNGHLGHGLADHLSILRRDLDISNFTSDLSGAPGKIATSLSNMTDKKLYEYLQVSNLFKDSDTASSIIRIAHMLEDYKIVDKEADDKRPEFVPGFNSSEDKQPLVMKPPVGPADVIPPEKPRFLKMSFPSAYYNVKGDNPIRQTNSLDVSVSPATLSSLNRIVEEMKESHRKRKRRKGPSLNIYSASDAPTAWENFHNQISQFHLYSEEAGVVDDLLHEMATLPIVHMIPKAGGTQIKLTFTFSNNGRAMWKPQRFPRDHETLPDHFYFVDFERHNAEIAAFHLDRVLGFRRVVPVVGREINITQDVRPYANYDIAKTIFVSPAGNVCFHSKCDYYCDTGHAVCGHPDALEGSFAAYLPTQILVKRKTWRHPWRRSYHKRRIADWQQRPLYCAKIKKTPPYNSGRRLLDVMDLAAFDFLTGNMDRHHYETFEDFGNYTFTLVLDNGRSFGKARYDQRDILVPIYQCCLFRYSTLLKLLKFEEGPRHLSDVMRDSMSRDPVNPILTEPHLAALDRRLKHILNLVDFCVTQNGAENVVIDDGF